MSKGQYPDWVTIKDPAEGKNPRVTATLVILGNDYDRWDYDHYIDDAIDLARKWEKEEITYARIMWLRTWLRENVQHDHNITFKGIRTMTGCKKWVEKVIRSEYRLPDWAESLKDQLAVNEAMFGGAVKMKVVKPLPF